MTLGTQATVKCCTSSSPAAASQNSILLRSLLQPGGHRQGSLSALSARGAPAQHQHKCCLLLCVSSRLSSGFLQRVGASRGVC